MYILRLIRPRQTEKKPRKMVIAPAKFNKNSCVISQSKNMIVPMIIGTLPKLIAAL